MKYYLVYNNMRLPIGGAPYDLHRIDSEDREYFFTQDGWVRAMFCDMSYHLKHTDIFEVKSITEEEANKILMMQELIK